MTATAFPTSIHESWREYLEPLFEIPSIQTLNHIILPTIPFFPDSKDIFNVFRMPMEEIKVVILGQDPYPQPNQAIGYAFAVDYGIRTPSSLNTIRQEVTSEYPNETIADINKWITLQHWRDQGVFLLNTALTVEAGCPNSHKNQWAKFTEGVIRAIAYKICPIWMLWGANARAYKNVIKSAEPIRDLNHILEAAHPAAEAYQGGKAGFYGCGHFKEANRLLREQDKEPIKWL